MTGSAGFSFTWEPGPADPKRLIVSVSRDGRPLATLHGAPYAKAFPAKIKPERLEAFCRRFAEDEAFRAATLVKDAFSCCQGPWPGFMQTKRGASCAPLFCLSLQPISRPCNGRAFHFPAQWKSSCP